MSGKTVRLFTIFVLLIAGGMRASAETPTENVTVTANKLREVFHKFTDTFATPTKLGGKIARWERRLCPLVLGQNPHFTAFITQRVKYIALAAGARLNTEASCTPNIEIIFTTTPQALMDSVRKDHPLYLGYADTNAQLEKLATVTRPVQAWYTTETRDANGRRDVDSVLLSDSSGGVMFMPHVYASSGGHINNGMLSGFFHILIVIDSTKMAGQKIVPLADYISMLALTQINSLDACQQQQPSVVNMLAADCDHAQDGVTEFDLAYLQGIYRMSAGRELMFQRNDIASTMADKVIDQKIAAARQ
jgi:hypothetical protein